VNWELVSAAAGIFFALLNLLNTYIVLKIRLEVAELKLHMAHARAKDKDELRTWVEESFVRRGEFEARLDALG
jgi:hypothetical protein